jgi:hypothetical protein
MQPKLKLKKESSMKKVDPTEYRSIVGSLRYLVNTRPALAFSIGYASRYMEEPHEDHLAAVKQILRYIAGTSGVGVFYPKKKEDRAELMGYSDSDLAGDLDSSVRNVLYCGYMGPGPPPA